MDSYNVSTSNFKEAPDNFHISLAKVQTFLLNDLIPSLRQVTNLCPLHLTE